MSCVRGIIGNVITALRTRAWRAVRAGRTRGDDWHSMAQERFLGHAADGADVERRQRTWDRDEANAYAMSGWA